MATPDPDPPGDDWAQRERHWRRKLGRLRLGVEPLQEQLARCRRVTWALSAVTGLIALMFVALFWAFEAPLVGVVVAGVLLLPVVGLSWLDFKILERRAARYQRERREYEERRIDRSVGA